LSGAGGKMMPDWDVKVDRVRLAGFTSNLLLVGLRR
jgi:hypothetical protein